jgi:hypothetical protein
MAIGTEVKVGFDGDEVKKGFAGIRGMFAGAARSFGKGAMMMAGAMGGRTLLDFGAKIATGTKDLAEFSGEMEDLATQTGVSVSEMVMFNRALQLAGANMDAGKVLSTLSGKIYDATHGGEDLQKVFAKIGISVSELQGINPMRQFMITMKALSKFTGDMDELNNITSEIFGGKMGMQTIRLFRNEDAMKNMGKDIQGFAKDLESNAENLGKFSDQMDRLPTVWMALNLAIAKILKVNGDSLKVIIDNLLALLNSSDPTELMGKIRSEYAKALEVINNSDFMKSFKDFFRDIGRQIGEGIKDSLNLDKIPGFGANNNAQPDRHMAQLLNATNQTNNILTSIERSNNRYA